MGKIIAIIIEKLLNVIDTYKNYEPKFVIFGSKIFIFEKGAATVGPVPPPLAFFLICLQIRFFKHQFV